MYEIQELPILPVLAEQSAKLPLNLLLIPPGPPWGDLSVPRFNPLGAVSSLLGDWDRAVKVLNPRVWAPSWNSEQLLEFANSAHPKPRQPFLKSDLQGLQISALTGLLRVKSEDETLPEYDVVHCVGVSLWFNISSSLEPHLHFGRSSLTVGALRDWLVQSRTRLLILQARARGELSFRTSSESRLAELIVGGGGPAVLTVAGGDEHSLTAYFMNLYGSILHNRPLVEAAQPDDGDLEVLLVYGKRDRAGAPSGSDLLRFDQWMKELSRHLNNYAETMSEYLEKLQELSRCLHRAQREEVTAITQTFENLARNIRDNQESLEHIRTARWDHEYEGVIPLSKVTEAYRRIKETAGQIGGEGFHLLDYDPLIAKAEWKAYRAPRVLNAGLADPKERRVLKPNDPLVADKEYDLLVDVGPRWSKIASLVKGNAEFPERALRPSAEGYLIQVVFVSQDFLVRTRGKKRAVFSPGLSSVQMFVPARTGRSFPYEKGERAAKSGPVVFRVRAPSFEGRADTSVQARGRLCLYYQNNLVQSALVVATVINKREAALNHPIDNEIIVDFRLTGTFQDTELFEQRKMVLDPQKEGRWATQAFEPAYEFPQGEQIQVQYHVGLNLTMNDDGSSKHRLLVKDHSDLPPAWKSYNASAATKILDDARARLEDCFWKKDEKNQCQVINDGKGQRQDALNSKLGKDIGQFRCDIFRLAIIGEKLYNTMFESLQGSGLEKFRWVEKLDKALDSKTVIQVARTGEAQYVYPWALVYDIPLPDWNNLRYCKVIAEEWKDGVRNKPPEPHCPHQATHGKKNTLCPYGFWGLKHYIEQPIPPLENDDLPASVATTINAGPTLDVAVGVTRDKALPRAVINSHLTELLDILGVKALVPAGGADDWPKVCDMLKCPDVVYFLCHGEFDGNDPYLGIGLRDKDVAHRVYPTRLYSWARTQDLQFWESWRNNCPLIFINGCHTFALKPSDVLNFVSAFAGFGAGGVVGTEISVRLPVAIEVAQMLFEGLAKTNMTIGEAMYQVRWKLANKGSLLGLAYTPYCMANLHIVKGQ